MNHDNHDMPENSSYTVKNFIPLIIIFVLIISLTLVKSYLSQSFDLYGLMNDFMGFFFLIFGGFKVVNLPVFVEAYRSYDLIAQRSTWYAYAYPFIELALGLLYVMQRAGKFVHIFTLVLMIVSAAGVAVALAKKRDIVCACLGAVFKIPMTYVTLLEDLLMAAMAAYMLVIT